MGTFLQLTPIPSATKKYSMTVLTWPICNRKFQKLLSKYKMRQDQFWCFKYFLKTVFVGKERGHCLCSSSTWWSLGIDIGPITTRNDFVFVPNRLPNLFARRPEVTRPLTAKVGPIEGGNGTCKASWEFRPPFCLFLTERIYFHFLIGRCPHGKPNNILILLDVAYGKIHSYRKKFENRIRWMRSLGKTECCKREFKHNMWFNFGFKFYFYFFIFLCFKVARYYTLPQPYSKI